MEINRLRRCAQVAAAPASGTVNYFDSVGAVGDVTDGGAFTLPANALSTSDNPGRPASFSNFICAIDDSGFFSKVTFFGDGFGAFLVAGGTLRFASVPEGSVDPNPAPEPATLALVGVALAGIAAARRRKARA